MAEATPSVNGRHVKNLPGRKTDLLTAAWLAQLAECGLLRGSFVPPPVIAELRGLARYGKKTKAVNEALEPDQVLALAAAVPPRYRAVVLSAAGLRLRPGEHFGLATDRLEFLKRSCA